MSRTVTASWALHARPASQLSGVAAGFDADITLRSASGTANPKSVLALMALDVQAGEKLEIEADGQDAERAVEAIAATLGEAGAGDA